MIAPGVWQDEGPGAAIHASSRARIESGRLVGQMVPDAPAGPNPLWKQRAATDPAVIAHQERRKAARKEKRAAG